MSKKLMAPGPVPMPDYVKRVFVELECHHRSKEFDEILVRVFAQIKKVFQTNQHCYLLASTGTGALEAGFINVLGSKDQLLAVNAGKFGERWGKIAKSFGVACDEIKVPWGVDPDLNQIEDALKKKKYSALAFQACETSTGAMLPTQELCQLAQSYGVLTMVDGITALGAFPLPMDQWGIDVLVGGSQKAFMLPTGMAFLSLSAAAEARTSDLPSFYFNLKSEKKMNLEGKTRWSTPTHFVVALELVLKEILETKGLANHFAEIARRAEVFREAVRLPLFPQTPSPSVSCLKVPDGLNSEKIKDQVSEEGYLIVGGQDELKGKVIRVGHMGDMNEQDLISAAEVIRKYCRV